MIHIAIDATGMYFSNNNMSNSGVFRGVRVRAGKRGIAPEESPFFPAPWGRGRGQLLKKHRGITGTGNRYDFGDFRGIFPED